MSEPDADEIGAALQRLRAPQRDLVARRLRAQLRRELLARDSPVDHIGRFTLRSPIGAGAMGTVIAAHDPELDREVALKLIPATDAGRRERALHEARALARLAHPNVVTVHEVGEYDDGVYVAMELVRGTTLFAHLQSGPHPWRALAPVFIEAGRGLAAAHAAGLVHRDFKPSNVLLGDDGRVRVVDFGLARVVDEASVDGDRRPGTPAYMAPEQLGGATVTAQADQFAFAVTVFEALHGRRPFAGGSVAELTRSIAAGPSWTERRAPASVRRAILRALSEEPDARFPSITDLVGRLAPTHRARSVALVLAAAVTGAAVAWGASGSPPRPCADVDDALSSAWDRDRKDALERAAAAAGALEIWNASRPVIDDWAERWTAMRREACEATFERHEQSERMLDLRMACLDRARGELAALGDALAHADAGGWVFTRAAVADLFALERCAATDVLEAVGPAPDDARVAELRDEIARCTAALRVGDYAGARALVAGMRAHAEALGHPPLVAEAALVAAEAARRVGAIDEAEALFREALWTAEAARHEQVAADAATSLVELVGTLQMRPARGLEWAEHARAAHARLGVADGLTIQLAHALVNVYRVAGRHDDAVRYAEIELALASAGGDPHWEAFALINLATAEGAAGRPRAAIEHGTRALELARTTWGADHPNIAALHNNLGNLLADVHELDAALAHYRRALAIWSARPGPHTARIATARMNVATVLKGQGRLDEALAELDAALPILRAAVGADHPDVAGLIGNRANVLLLLDRPEDARAEYRIAIAGYRAATGEPSPDIALALVGLGRTERVLGRPHAAITALEEALGTADAGALRPVVRAEIRLELARARVDAGIDRTRSLAVVRDAANQLRAAGVEPELLVDVEAWLAEHAAD